jgi:hypothetical protein
VIEVALVVGFALGYAIGRWWAIAPAPAVGVWVALTAEVEAVPAWFLGLGYALIGSVAIAAGVAIRRRR